MSLHPTTTSISLRIWASMLAAGLLVSTALFSFADDKINASTRNGIVHTVVFWFKPGTTAATVENIISEVEKFESLPMVNAVYVGQPLMSDRDVVDDSFGIALTLIFDDEKSLRQYEADPYHKRISGEIILPNVIRGVIYDHYYDRE